MTTENRHEYDDPQVSELLRDAYDAPPIPVSLIQRLNTSIESEYEIPLSGENNSNDSPPIIISFVQRSARVLRSWPIAAAISLAACGWLFLREGNVAYGWFKMVDAIQSTTSEVFEVSRKDSSGESTRHWVSLSRGLIGESQSNVTRIWDHRRGVVTLRRGDQVRRAKFSGGELNLDPQRLVLSVMLGRSGELADIQNVSIRDQGWTESDDGVRLQVAADVDGDELPLEILLDNETSLPKSVGGESRDESADVRFLKVSADEMLANSIPAHLAVEEVALERLDPLSDVVAKVEPMVAPDADPTTNVKVEPEHEKVPVIGAASLAWKAVAKPGLSEQAFVQNLNDLLSRLWRENNVQPTSQASEAEIVRRAYLDLIGRTPTVSELRDYADDARENRYEHLVDSLLSSRDHATHVAAVWRSFLLPEGVDLTRFGGTKSFDAWMSKRLRDGAGYDQIVRELLLAEGRLTNSGPLLFYAASKLDADKLAARSARVFLGMRLECAQCHDDPFEPYTQEDFWSYAAFFAQISRPQAELETVSTVMRVRDVSRGEVMYPDTEEVVAPQFLDLAKFDASPKADSRRQQLARWMTASENPFFARATANRVWAHMFGKGIVNPVDGFGDTNEPRSEELLELVAGHLVENGFNLRALFRGLALSDAYRLSSGATAVDSDRRDWFAQMSVKMLTAEQVYDCITVASMLGTAVEDGFNIARVGNASRDQFIALFKTPAGQSNRYHGGIPQALTLMNGGLIQSATGLSTSGLLKTLDAPFLSDDQRVEVLYQATLSRKPSEAEWATLRAYIADLDSPKEAYADVLWTLLNSAEFTMNH